MKKTSQQKYRGKRDRTEQDAFYEQIKKERRNSYYLIAIAVIANVLFLYFFSWLFFEKVLFLRAIPVIVCLLDAVVLFKTLPKLFPKASTIMLVIPILSFIGFCFLFDRIQSKIQDDAFKNHGKIIHAVISHKEWKTEKRAKDSRWVINATFEADKKIYTTFFIDLDNKYKVGDTVRVIYSTINPEINKFVDLKE